MPPLLLQILAILSTLCGAGVSLVMLVLLMASGANSSEKQIREIWIFFWTVIVLAVVCGGGAVWSFLRARYGLSAAIGILPALFCIGLTIWAVVTEW